MKLSSVLGVLLMIALSGCATRPYPPYQGSDAAELSLSSTSALTTTVFTIDKSSCPEPKLFTLAHFEANTTWWGHKDTKEFKTEPIQIPPNTMFGMSVMSGGTNRCVIDLAFLPKPNSRYQLKIDSEGFSCTASIRRVQDGQEVADVQGFRIPKGALSTFCF